MMQNSRPVVYNNGGNNRTKETVHMPKVEPMAVKMTGPRKAIDKKTPLSFDFNEDDDSQIITFFEQQRKDPDFVWRGYKILEIDNASNIVKLLNLRTGETIRKLKNEFITQARLDIKFNKGKAKIDGKVVQRNDIINLIKQDIQNRRPFQGKRIIGLDESTNLITIEGSNIFGTYDRESIDTFILRYLKSREFGYLDSETTIQDLAEQTRLQNIEDMTTAFKNALGIKPPKVTSYKQLRQTRQIDIVRGPLMNRDGVGYWTKEELTSVYKTGKIPNAPIKVNGEIHNVFMPMAPEMTAVRENPDIIPYGKYISDKE